MTGQRKPAVRIPKQKRSEETRARIIEAGTRLFSSEGYHNTSSKKIAREAGVAIGSFYNYFEDKKALLMEVYRLHTLAVHSRVAELLREARFGAAGSDGRATVAAIVEQAEALHSLSPEFHRETTALRYTDPEFEQAARAEEQQIVASLVAILEPHRDSLRVDDLEAAAHVVVSSVEEVIHSVKIFDSPIETERITAALADMIYRFLYREPD